MRRRRRRNEHRLMAVLGVVAVSAMVLADSGPSGDVSDTPTGTPEAADLPRVRLHLSGADIAHFERLHDLLDGRPPRNPQRYRQENTWRRAQLGYDDRLYDIRVKSHGRDPDYHSERLAGWRYRFISLTIRLEAGERILGLNRFKLIVHGAFPDAASIMGMARHVGAFVQDHRPVRVRINNWPEHLVYFSNVLDNRYLESSAFAPFRRISYDYPETGNSEFLDERTSDHSLIYTDRLPLEWEPEAFRRRFELALAQMEIPESEWAPLFERYAAFNAALSGSAATDTDPTEFLDPGYMQRYETARYVLGLSGHGSLFGNLRVALNTANGKFYPAFNRDNKMSELDLSGGRIPELQINNLGSGFAIPQPLPLFHYAAASAPLRQRVYREIYRFIERIAAGDGRPAGGAGRPEAGCRRPFVGGSPFVGEARPVGAAPCGAASPPSPDLVAGTVASSNIESLRTYLEASAPEFSARVTPERLTVTIRPNSMSALRIQALTIGSDHGQDPVRVDVTEGHGPQESLMVEVHPAAVREDGTVDLGGALVDARFFTGVALRDAAVPVRVNIRWIAGLEDAHRQRLEQRFGLLEGKLESTRTWHYSLWDTSPARLADIVGNDAVEDTHGFNRGDFSLADHERDTRRRLTRAPHLYELVFTFSRPLPRLRGRVHRTDIRQHGDRPGGRGPARRHRRGGGRGSPLPGKRLRRPDRPLRGLGGGACMAGPSPYGTTRDHVGAGRPRPPERSGLSKRLRRGHRGRHGFTARSRRRHADSRRIDHGGVGRESRDCAADRRRPAIRDGRRAGRRVPAHDHPIPRPVGRERCLGTWRTFFRRPEHPLSRRHGSISRVYSR